MCDEENLSTWKNPAYIGAKNKNISQIALTGVFAPIFKFDSVDNASLALVGLFWVLLLVLVCCIVSKFVFYGDFFWVSLFHSSNIKCIK